MGSIKYFGQYANEFRYIPAHMISEKLGPDCTWRLLLLHAITGCDTLPQFAEIGKKTAFAVFIQVTHTYVHPEQNYNIGHNFFVPS